MNDVKPLAWNRHSVIIAVINKQQVVIQACLGGVISVFTESEFVETQLVGVVVVYADLYRLSCFKEPRENRRGRVNAAIFIWSWYGVCDRVAAKTTIPCPVGLNFDLDRK